MIGSLEVWSDTNEWQELYSVDKCLRHGTEVRNHISSCLKQNNWPLILQRFPVWVPNSSDTLWTYPTAYVHGLYFKSMFSSIFLRAHLHDINVNTPKISIQSYCTQDHDPNLCRAKFKIIHSFQQSQKIFVLDDEYLIPTVGYQWRGKP